MSFPRTGQTNDKTKEIDLLFFVFFFIYEQFSFLYSENITPAVRNVLNYSWRSVNFGQGLLTCGKNSLSLFCDRRVAKVFIAFDREENH